MRVDFYQLSRDRVEKAIAQLAKQAVAKGLRLVVVAQHRAQLDRIGEALWQVPATFLANGHAGGVDDSRQPILLSDTVQAGNGATVLVLADGIWREPAGFERVLLFFDSDTVAAARQLWVEVGKREGVERQFHRQEGPKWVRAA